MCKNFSIKDIKIVAKAVFNTELEYVKNDKFGGYYYCTYCNKEMPGYFSSSNFKHDINCPVLVAKDLLTRI